MSKYLAPLVAVGCSSALTILAAVGGWHACFPACCAIYSGVDCYYNVQDIFDKSDDTTKNSNSRRMLAGVRAGALGTWCGLFVHMTLRNITAIQASKASKLITS